MNPLSLRKTSFDISANVSRMKRMFGLMQVKPHHVILPVILSFFVALSSGATIALLFPLFETIRQDQFESALRTSFGGIFAFITFLDLPPKEIAVVLLSLIFIAQLLKHILEYCNRVYCHHISGYFEKNISGALFHKYMLFGKSYFDKESQGKIRTMFVAAHQIPELVSVVREFITAMMKFCVRLCVLVLISWPLTVIIALLFPVLYSVLLFFMKRLKNLAKSRHNTFLEIGKEIHGILSNISMIKAYGLEVPTEKRFGLSLEEYRKVDFNAKVYQFVMKPVQQIVLMTALFSVVYLVMLFLAEEGLSEITKFVIFIYAAEGTLPIINTLSQSIMNFASLWGGIDSIHGVLDKEPEGRCASGHLQFSELKKEITCRNLSFGYDDDHHVLQNVNACFAKGTFSALVGSTGSGKTTLLYLLMCLYEAPSDSILIDGQPIEDFAMRSIRRNIAYVSQETILFHGTFRENVTFGIERNVSEEEIRDVCQKACLVELVDRLPHGFDTCIGEKGIQLSGGERQRLAIARLFLRNAQILFLDEATSALDSETEGAVHRAIHEYGKQKTVIMVAHRLSTVKNADQIIVFDQGRIVETGSWQELMESKKSFHSLWQSQFS